MATRELRGAPRILPLYARAAAPLLPGASRLPFVGGGGGEIPELELMLRQVRVESSRLDAYREVCGFPRAQTLPVTYPHILAFPMHLALMTDGGFPFGPIGLVHIANAITQHRPLQVHELLDLRVHATPLQQHPRGRSFSLISEARVKGELVWEERSTMLRRGTGGKAGETASARLVARLPTGGEEWSLPADLGRRYAAASADRNPIHLHPLTARLLGFQSAIAHGMWTKARALAALEQHLPQAVSVKVRFRAPISLPGKVSFASSVDGEELTFGVSGAAGEPIHLEGRAESSSGATESDERSSTP